MPSNKHLTHHRGSRRSKYDEATRLSLLEDDVDELEVTFSKVSESQSRIQSLLWGVMSALLVAVVLLALNLALGQIPTPG